VIVATGAKPVFAPTPERTTTWIRGVRGAIMRRVTRAALIPVIR